MTLTELRYIVALAREKHFSNAAKACHVSQPTLSVAIQKLESELSVSIFERVRNDVHITDMGKKIIAQAERALEEVNTLKEIAKSDKSQLNYPLKIGAIYTVAPYLFPNLVPKLSKIAPHMPLLIQEDYTANLRVKLRNGELDAIFIALPFTEPGVVSQKLYSEPFVALLPKKHPLAKKKSLSPEDLIDETILMLEKGNCLRDQVLSICPKCTVDGEDQQIIEGTSIETLRHMVASGTGITILPCSATQIQFYKSILCTKPFTGKTPQRHIALAWRASFTRPKAIDAIIKALTESHMKEMCLLPH